MCYAPPNASLQSQVRLARSRDHREWSIINGFDILLESCILQFEQFTGFRAPRAVMEHALRAAIGTETT